MMSARLAAHEPHTNWNAKLEMVARSYVAYALASLADIVY